MMNTALRTSDEDSSSDDGDANDLDAAMVFPNTPSSMAQLFIPSRNAAQSGVIQSTTAQQLNNQALELGGSDNPMPDDTEKKKKLLRVLANRKSARESRERRKVFLSKLQSSVDILTAENRTLTSENAQLRARVIELTQQLINSNAQQANRGVQRNSLNTEDIVDVGPLLQQQQQQPSLRQQLSAVNANMMNLRPVSIEQQLFQQQNLLIQDLRAQEQQQQQQQQQQTMLRNQLQIPQGAVPHDLQSSDQLEQELLLAAAIQRANNQNQFR
jgi:hypothetical protein